MSNDPPEANPEMVYSRPGGMTEHEKAKIRRNMSGGRAPNASGARQQEAPAILAGSEPSRDLVPPKLTPEEEAIAEANRQARDAASSPQGQLDPVNGEVDPMDAVHETAASVEPIADGEPGPDAPPATDALLE